MAQNAPGKHYRTGLSLIELDAHVPRRRGGGTLVRRDTPGPMVSTALAAVPWT